MPVHLHNLIVVVVIANLFCKSSIEC